MLWLFFSLFSSYLEKSAKKAIPYNFTGFSSFVPPKGLSLKSFSSSYSTFPCFPFVFSFKFQIFSLLVVRQPLFGKHSFLGSSIFIFCCLSFVNVCLFFETNFSDILFFKTNLLPFWLFLSCSMFWLFCFVLALFLVCLYLLLFCFCFGSCFAFRLWKILFSPAILVLLSHVGYKVVYFYVFCFCSCLICLVFVCFQSKLYLKRWSCIASGLCCLLSFLQQD